MLSGKKLREKFDTIAGQILRDRYGGHNGTGAKELGTCSGDPPGPTSERRTSRGERNDARALRGYTTPQYPRSALSVQRATFQMPTRRSYGFVYLCPSGCDYNRRKFTSF